MNIDINKLTVEQSEKLIDSIKEHIRKENLKLDGSAKKIDEVIDFVGNGVKDEINSMFDDLSNVRIAHAKLLIITSEGEVSSSVFGDIKEINQIEYESIYWDWSGQRESGKNLSEFMNAKGGPIYTIESLATDYGAE